MGVASLIGQSRPTCEISSGCTVLTGSLRPHDARARAFFLWTGNSAANTDTVPAKFSAKNAADDKLVTIAYTFKTLTDDERRAIYQALKDQPASAFNGDVGIEVPPGIELTNSEPSVLRRAA
jgi:hypothetical protein